VSTEVPEGFWEAGITFPQPIAPMTRVLLTVSTRALADAFAEFGPPMDGVEWRELGGWVYVRVVPLGGREPPRPPRWFARPVNTVMSRVAPLLRRRVAGLEEVERTDALVGLAPTRSARTTSSSWSAHHWH
jgi:pyruvate,water dikinase